MYDREVSGEQGDAMPPMRQLMYFYRRDMQRAANLRRIWRESARNGEKDDAEILKTGMNHWFFQAMKVKAFVLEWQSYMRDYRGDDYRVEYWRGERIGGVN